MLEIKVGKATILQGDCLEGLRTLPDESVQCCVTSPPYWGLRDYGMDGQLGGEATPREFVEGLVAVFREVRRVLRNDGTLWLNLGDSYSGGSSVGAPRPGAGRADGVVDDRAQRNRNGLGLVEGLRSKNLVGIPWRVAFALQDDGWYLRSDIIWSKPNPMPESVTDRPTKAHEYIFLLAKSEKYFYDNEAIKEASVKGNAGSEFSSGKTAVHQLGRSSQRERQDDGRRNKRTVWEVATQPFPGAHFAVYPPKLIEPCILAGSRRGDVVLDPFNGSGTTGLVSLDHGRRYIGCELNPEYVGITVPRLEDAQRQMTFFDEFLEVDCEKN